MGRLLTTCLLTAGACIALSASAAEIKVLTAGAFKPVAVAVIPEFEKQTGHKVKLENDTAGALTTRIAAGEKFDVTILTPSALDQFAKSGQVDGASIKRLARVAIGVAVKDGAPLPDISSVPAFQKTLLAARAVAYIDPAAGGSSGIYMSNQFDKMGIGSQIRAKAVLVPGGHVADRVVNGEADLGIHQISEIIAVKGVTLVGPIPAEMQNYTVYAGALGAHSTEVAAAQAFLRALSSANALAILKGKGMEAP